MTSSKAKISVIIPVYNTAPYLRESIGSITNQTFREIEIIIIDDGSTDESPVVLKEFSERDERIKILTQKNAGQSVARNRGLEIACGEYLYFMDSDDRLDKEALEGCYRKCVSDSLDLVLFNGNSFFEDDYQKPIFDYNIADSINEGIHTGLEIFTKLVKTNKFSSSPCLYLIKRDVLEKNSLRFYPGIIHEDNLFSALAYIYSGRTGIIPRSYFQRRIRGNSTMTSKITWRNIIGYLTTCSEILKISSEMTSPEKEAVNYFVSGTMTAVCYKARKLPLSQRIKYVGIMLREYKQYVPLIEIIKVFIPKR